MFFSDSNCKKLLTTILLSLTVLIFASSWSGSQTASTQKSFFITNDGKQTYAIIYNNGETAILEMVEINGDSITIDTTAQKIISINNIDIKKYTFKNVEIERVDQLGNKE